MAYEQSVSWWCIARDNTDLVDMLQTCKAIGYTAMELVPVEQFAIGARSGHEDRDAWTALGHTGRH